MDKSFRENHKKIIKNYVGNKTEATSMMSRSIIPCLDAAGNSFPGRISIANINIDGMDLGMAIIHDYSSFLEELLSLERTSKIDPLTNLFNRRYLGEITKPGSRILSTWTLIGVLYIDLDDFKPINDHYGHDFGDKVIKAISHRIKERLRFNDIPIRIGGDEFIILLNLEDTVDLPSILNKIGLIIHDEISTPIEIGNTSVKVGVSIGIGEYPNDSDNLATLIKLADKAMYEAKNRGLKTMFVSDLNTY